MLNDVKNNQNNYMRQIGDNRTHNNRQIGNSTGNTNFRTSNKQSHALPQYSSNSNYRK